MRFISQRKIYKNPNFYYFLLVFLVVLFPLIHYPTIYGVDSFQVIWMANALKNGALFSENSWLIHPLSYFGYYPFSHRAIGVPIFLAFIMTILDFISFGNFGISESILVLDIIIILVIYKSARNLGNTLFEEKWSRFIFVTTILFSQIVLNTVTMTVSTRIIIIIIMLNLLNLNLKLINNSIKKRKAIILMILLILIGALAHRLWIVTTITIIFSVIMILIRKSRKLKKISIILILPVSVIAFFLGLEIISVFDLDFLTRLDPNQTFSPFIDEESLLGVNILLGWFYTWNTGLILIFFPIGLIIIFYQLTISVKNFEGRDNHIENKKQQLQKFYIILFIIPLTFLLPTTFYSIVIFFPLLIILSVYGLIQIRKILSAYSESISWLLLGGLVILSIFYASIKVELSTQINLWYIFTLPLIAFFLIFSVLILRKCNYLDLRNITLDSQKLKKGVWNIILIISIIIFSITTIETNRAGLVNSIYPWENSYLTDEEIEIIKFFETEEINGLIFTIGITSIRFSGIGFLPAFHNYSSMGLDLWYNLISPDVVLQKTIFSFSISKIFTFDFFEMNMSWSESNPLWIIIRNIKPLNMTIKRDRDLLFPVYNVQYIISVKEPFLKSERSWILTQSLFKSDLNPIFSTKHLLVWEIVG